MSKCTSPIHLKSGKVVPCGQCRACRFNVAREWAARMMHEVLYHETSCFVTLTYDDSTVPPDGGLEVDVLQRFFKRLREEVKPTRIKYYACGEYGDVNERPHYHAVVFGLGLDDHKVSFRVKSSWAVVGGPVYSAWDLGFVSMSDVGMESALYVAKYVRKKKTGERAQEYGSRVAPFCVCSKGLGKRYAKEHAEQIKENCFISVNGHRMAVPRYYRDIVGLTSEEVFRKTEERRDEAVKAVYEKVGSRDHFRHVKSPVDRARLLREQGDVQRERTAIARDDVEERSAG